VPWAVPDSVTSSIIDSQMTIDGSDLRSFVFDPLLSKLAEEVVITTPNSQPCQVLLSGILSECPYVSKFMENYSLGLVSKRLTILKPTDG
jgi:hypothetical protein